MKTITFTIYHNNHFQEVEIKDTKTLSDLAEKIITAFNYENNHAHAFFLDNTYWGTENILFSDGLEDEKYMNSIFNKPTNYIKLKEVNFQPNVEFKFIFDFGEEQRFQCKVIEIKE